MKKLLLTFGVILTLSNLVSQASWASFNLSDSICEGSNANVLANTGTVIASGYTWTALPSGPMVSSPNSSNTPITFPSFGTYTISLTVSSGTDISTYSDTIVVLALPTLSVSGPTSPICPPPTAIGGLSMSGSGASTYTWNPGNVTGANYWQVQPSVSTTFTLDGTDSFGCTNSTTYYVQVLPMPSVWASGPSMICVNEFTCISAGGSLWNYVWNGPCGFSANGANQCFSLSFGCGGTFTVGGTDGQCVGEATLNIIVSACTGISPIEVNDQTFKLSPNPVIDKLNVISSFYENSNTQLELSDISGRIISRSKCNFNSEGVYEIDISEFSSGIYFVRIVSEDQISQQVKVLKE